MGPACKVSLPALRPCPSFLIPLCRLTYVGLVSHRPAALPVAPRQLSHIAIDLLLSDCLFADKCGDKASNKARLASSHPMPDLSSAGADLKRRLEGLHAALIENLSIDIPQRKCGTTLALDATEGSCTIVTRRKGGRWGRMVSFTTSNGVVLTNFEQFCAHELGLERHAAAETDPTLRARQRLAAPESHVDGGQPTAVGMVAPMQRDARAPPVATFGDAVMSLISTADWSAIRRQLQPLLLLTLAAAVKLDGPDQPTVMILEHGDTDGPLNRGGLAAVRNLQLGGKLWKQAERREGADGCFSWVYDQQAASRPLHRHAGEAPLLVLSRNHRNEHGGYYTLVAKGSDFRGAFALGSVQREAIARWEAGVLKGNLLGVKMINDVGRRKGDRPSGGRTFADCLQAYDVAHNKRHGTYHMYWSVHAHDGCGATYTSPVEGDEAREWQGRVPYCHFDEGAGSAGRDLFRSLVEPFAHFATEIYKRTWPLEQQCWAQEGGRVHHDHPWSYWSFSVYADKDSGSAVSKSLHGTLSKEPNVTVDGSSAGLDLHEDEGNKSATVVLIFGTDLEGFDQIYPTAGVRIACGCWAFACADARELLHAVAHGRGFRVALVYATHTVMAEGHDSKCKPVLWPQRKLTRNGINGRKKKAAIALPPSAGCQGCACSFCGVQAFEAAEVASEVASQMEDAHGMSEEPLLTRGGRKRHARD